MSGLQNCLNKSCRRCVLAPGAQLAPGAERGVAKANKMIAWVYCRAVIG